METHKILLKINVLDLFLRKVQIPNLFRLITLLRVFKIKTTTGLISKKKETIEYKIHSTDSLVLLELSLV